MRFTARPFAPSSLFPLLLAFAALGALSVLCALHARALRHSRARVSPLERFVGPELPLGSAARWLRHRASAEPHAAIVDPWVPFDQEPAGLLLRPLSVRALQTRALVRVRRAGAL